MLIQKPIENGDIITVKTTNGDEIVAKLVNQDSNSYTLSRPVVLGIQPVGNQVSLTFLPFIMSSDEDGKIVFPISSLQFKPVKTRSDVANNYRKATSSIESVNDMGSLLKI